MQVSCKDEWIETPPGCSRLLMIQCYHLCHQYVETGPFLQFLTLCRHLLHLLHFDIKKIIAEDSLKWIEELTGPLFLQLTVKFFLSGLCKYYWESLRIRINYTPRKPLLSLSPSIAQAYPSTASSSTHSPDSPVLDWPPSHVGMKHIMTSSSKANTPLKSPSFTKRTVTIYLPYL